MSFVYMAGLPLPAAPHLDHYVESLKRLEDQTPEHQLVRQLSFELEALRPLPPRSATSIAGMKMPPRWDD